MNQSITHTKTSGMNFLLATNALNLVQNSKIHQSISEMTDVMENQAELIAEQNALNARIVHNQEHQLDMQAQQLAIQKKQALAHDIEANHKRVSRAIKETVFQLRRHIKEIEAQSDPFVKFVLYSTTLDELSISESHSEMIDEITDKEYLLDTLEMLQKNSRDITNTLSEEDLQKIETLSESGKLYSRISEYEELIEDTKKIIAQTKESLELETKSNSLPKNSILTNIRLFLMKGIALMFALVFASITFMGLSIGKYNDGLTLTSGFLAIVFAYPFYKNKIFGTINKDNPDATIPNEKISNFEQELAKMQRQLQFHIKDYIVNKSEVEKLLNDYPILKEYVSVNEE